MSATDITSASVGANDTKKLNDSLNNIDDDDDDEFDEEDDENGDAPKRKG